MRLSLLFVVILLLGTSAQAQNHHPATSSSNSQSSLNTGWSGGPGEIGSRGRAVRYESPRTLPTGSAQNDGPFLPSTFMNYNDALALGQQQLAEQEASRVGTGTSLGEIARAYRTAKVPTLRLQSRVVQDYFGHLEVCNLNGNDCHRP